MCQLPLQVEGWGDAELENKRAKARQQGKQGARIRVAQGRVAKTSSGCAGWPRDGRAGGGAGGGFSVGAAGGGFRAEASEGKEARRHRPITLTSTTEPWHA